jgi:hypothetical protein
LATTQTENNLLPSNVVAGAHVSFAAQNSYDMQNGRHSEQSPRSISQNSLACITPSPQAFATQAPMRASQ